VVGGDDDDAVATEDSGIDGAVVPCITLAFVSRASRAKSRSLGVFPRLLMASFISSGLSALSAGKLSVETPGRANTSTLLSTSPLSGRTAPCEHDIAGNVAVLVPGLGNPSSIARRRGEVSLPASLPAGDDNVRVLAVAVYTDAFDSIDLLSSRGLDPSVWILGTSRDVLRGS
jgi:hypothetical protein